jgi:hypothetical protein
LPTGKYPNIINVFLVLTVVRVEIECGSIRDIAAGFIGDNGNVVAYLALVRIAFERVERIAHRNVRRPGSAGVSAERIE